MNSPDRNYIDEFRNSHLTAKMSKSLSSYRGPDVALMEVCGTHTMSIFRFGIRDLLPQSIKLISGPGCPVCVTSISYVDAAIAIAQKEDVIITTFGDMVRVPGTSSSLLKEKASGRDIRLLYSPLDALDVAKDNPSKKVVFLSIGFETTTPVIALTIIKAQSMGLKNFSVLAANKTIPEALKLLSRDESIKVHGFLYPGHVSAIIGTQFYHEIADAYGVPGVVAGFEPLDILYAINTLATNIAAGKKNVENLYSRAVTREGNQIAMDKMSKVFEPCDAVWRGIGNIPGSGLKVRQFFEEFDAYKIFDIQPVQVEEPKGCICGDILKGKMTPRECALFGKACTPENPFGACMVSSEGTCAAYYKYSI